MSDEQPALQTVAPPEPAPLSPWHPVALSPVHHQHAALGASFRREGLFDLPASYGDPQAEQQAIRNGLGIADVTARGKIDLRGPIDDIFTRLPATPDLLRAALSAQWALLLTRPGAADAYLAAARVAAGDSGMAIDATSLYAAFVLAGPRVDEVLTRLTDFDARQLKPGMAAGSRLARIAAVLLRRDLPVPVIELLVPSEYGRYIWETLLSAGLPLNARPVGWDALTAAGWS